MIPAFLLVLCAVAYRIAMVFFAQPNSTWLSNFAPLAAIALCGAAYFPRRYKFAVPMLALLISDVVLNAHYGFSFFSPFVISHYIGFAIIGCLGLLLQNRASLATLLPASIASSVIFYVITNTVSWLFDPAYPKTLVGLVQAQTVGVAAYSATPTWMFLRNALVSDLLFTGVFVLCMQWARSTERSRASVAFPRPA